MVMMQEKSYSGLDLTKYASLMRFIARMSRLFSDSATPLIVYRFVEKAFVKVTGARDLSRKDISFDAAIAPSRGVGVKTFRMTLNTGHKLEKVAEFTADARNGAFTGLPPEAIATVVSDLRNVRLRSDATQVGLSLSESFYHCLVRAPGGVLVHEEDMAPVDIERIKPISAQGKPLRKFSTANDDHVRFTDGTKEYTFHRSKNTLMQRFRLTTGYTSPMIDLTIDEGIWEVLLSGEMGNVFEMEEAVSAGSEDLPSVILPLYSSKSSILKVIPPKSGINQWNAGGRARQFGEAYIPIPRKVHNLHPGFFPPRDKKFELYLPSGEYVTAKVCQDGSKALMSDPNTALCTWLFSAIDGEYSYAKSRHARKRPYTYEDLERIGKDSVKVTRLDQEGTRFELELAPVGSFEAFINAELEEFDEM
jgi:hypothetical protein